jgi:hypothetical protein
MDCGTDIKSGSDKYFKMSNYSKGKGRGLKSANTAESLEGSYEEAF